MLQLLLYQRKRALNSRCWKSVWVNECHWEGACHLAKITITSSSLVWKDFLFPSYFSGFKLKAILSCWKMISDLSSDPRVLCWLVCKSEYSFCIRLLLNLSCNRTNNPWLRAGVHSETRIWAIFSCREKKFWSNILFFFFSQQIKKLHCSELI